MHTWVLIVRRYSADLQPALKVGLTWLSAPKRPLGDGEARTWLAPALEEKAFSTATMAIILSQTLPQSCSVPMAMRSSSTPLFVCLYQVKPSSILFQCIS